jgi:hypothetical protein
MDESESARTPSCVFAVPNRYGPKLRELVVGMEGTNLDNDRTLKVEHSDGNVLDLQYHRGGAFLSAGIVKIVENQIWANTNVSPLLEQMLKMREFPYRKHTFVIDWSLNKPQGLPMTTNEKYDPSPLYFNNIEMSLMNLAVTLRRAVRIG